MRNSSIALALMLTWLALVTSARADDAALKRCAVLASPEVLETGVADLLVTELSQQPGVELVERERLREALSELRLSAALGPRSVEQRLRLGKLLKADALILMEQVDGPQQSLHWVICDTALGARLASGHLPIGAANAAEQARRLAARVEEVRKRFPRGVERVVGVSPFLSKNLAHQYDHLQLGYAELLQNALSSYSGVAVIETEEARAIRNELDIAAIARLDRTSPVLVEAEYEMQHQGPGRPPTVSIAVRIDAARGQTRTIRPDAPLFDEVPQLLSTVLAKEILQFADGRQGSPFSAQQQYQWMCQRADEFAAIGMWERSTALREAALLLSPRQLKQRQRLLAEYAQLASPPARAIDPRGAAAEDPQFRELVARRVAAYIRSLPNLQYIVLHEMVADEEAFKLIEQHSTKLFIPDNSPGYLPLKRPGYRAIEYAEEAEHEFLMEVFPVMLQRRGGAAKVGREWLIRWQGVMLTSAHFRADRLYYLPSHVEFMERLLTREIPPNQPLCPAALRFLYYPGAGHHPQWSDPNFPGWPADDEVSEQRWLQFLETLSASGNLTNQFYGRFGIFCRKWLLKRKSATPEELQTLLAESGRFVEEAKVLDAAALDKDQPAKKPPSGGFASHVQYQIQHKIDHPWPRPAPPRPVAAAIVRPVQPRPVPPAFPAQIGRLKFEPIHLSVVNPDKSKRPMQTDSFPIPAEDRIRWRLTRCGDMIDVIWHSGVALMMRRPGELEILAQGGTGIDSVTWDGQHIWVGNRSSGIGIYDTAGKRVATIGTAEGLPPTQWGVILCGYDQGRVVAVGCFGNNRRAWCAAVDYRDGAAKVNVFFKATRSILQSEYLTAPDDLHLVFDPQFLHLFNSADPKRKMVLLGRHNLPARKAFDYPLLIDLNTLDVTIFPETLYVCYERHQDPLASYRGTIFQWQAPDNGLRYYTPDTARPGRYKMRRLYTDMRIDAPEDKYLSHQGWIYGPWTHWCRFNPETLELEKLTEEPLPGAYAFPLMMTQAISAHYGLVSFGLSMNNQRPEYNGWHFYRVDVLDVAAPKSAPLKKRKATGSKMSSSTKVYPSKDLNGPTA